ncbi:hypothetical protein SAMN02800694_0005 [Luteibacter sp. UNCMF331Sha3.1]|uniref:hypothetical protein n=1 Tax=Luteibacter sp. UNCMF331Sha3.1 TaxID=1502760 RepID=UPI0008CCB864|nr:hypothetical protein [Luteibacter sp. UNCMF331Sha3.1]SEM16089.1 hypothetical protein SAMN02800694_0005 [Luteibacter sp. UNCMF331Sha3.1]
MDSKTRLASTGLLATPEPLGGAYDRSDIVAIEASLIDGQWATVSRDEVGLTRARDEAVDQRRIVTSVSALGDRPALGKEAA